MTHSANHTAHLWLDYEVLPTETIDLSPDSISQALELSAQIPNQERQWRTYLNVLALCGFEEWLTERATDLTLNRAGCSVLQPPVANAIDAVCNLKVNEFNLCLITTGSLTDEEVTLPRAVIDLPEFVPHFYVLVEVQEEQETAVVCGILSYEQLVKQRTVIDLQAEEDWTYQLPLTWFEDEPDRLLLSLRCLEPTASPLPLTLSVSAVSSLTQWTGNDRKNLAGRRSVSRSMQLSKMRSELEALLPQLQSPDLELWQVLTWEQGTSVLTNPELLNWIYQVQRQQDHESKGTNSQVKTSLTDLFQLLTQPAVNVGCWLWDELDEFAQQLSWVLLPTFTATSLRSPIKEFEAIVTQLEETGVEIPLQARGAYRDLRLAGVPLRLYAVTWPLLSESIPEWTLLLVLGAAPGSSLPSGLQLRVSDQTSVLVEQVLDTQQQDSYFFIRVVGTWDEKFVVTIKLMPGIEQTLPPFSFNPERSR